MDSSDGNKTASVASSRAVRRKSSRLWGLCPRRQPDIKDDKTTATTRTEKTTEKTTDKPRLIPIPSPPGLPLLGHVASVNKDLPIETLIAAARKYGPIYKMNFFGSAFISLGNHELVHEVCDDKRFKKSIDNEIGELRAGTNDGLFTSSGEDEENWGIAHRILVPAFGPLAVRGMFPEMHEMATQLALKWARHGPASPIALADDFTRLAMDTIALCAMGFRFNSYYREDLHPFVAAMYGFLRAASDRTMRPPGVPGLLFRGEDKRFKRDIEALRRTAMEVLTARKGEVESGEGAGANRRDLLTAMLEGVDQKTGKKMTDESIIDNLITFLIAGHETTASTLSFVVYRLISHPKVYQRAQDEVDEVVGKEELTVNHIPRLKYLTAVIRETMRFHSSIPFIAREALSDTVVGGGRYAVKAKEQFVPLIELVHTDPAVYGPTADEFDPERMLDDVFDERMRRFPHCWMPFGTGMRACIGRAFAWQEMMLALALLLQSFRFTADDPGYKLEVSQALTIKPKGFLVRAVLRDGLTPAGLEARLVGGRTGGVAVEEGDKKKKKDQGDDDAVADGLRPMSVLYGSNSGTCEFMAQRLAADALQHGFRATVDVLDAGVDSLQTGRPVVVITTSYEGEPPHNAAQFSTWLEGLKGKTGVLEGVRYAVFGCGHRDWAQTFHRVPKLVDAAMEQLGAKRMVSLGTTDAKERDMFSDFETWEDEHLWPAVEAEFGCSGNNAAGRRTVSVDSGSIEVTLSTPRATILHQDVHEALVVESRTLAYRQDDTTDMKRRTAKGHMEIRLPDGTSYTTGDYLAVLPHNPKQTVARVMRRFGLAWDAHMAVRSLGPTVLPTERVPVVDVLSSYVELAQPATRRNITSLGQLAKDDDQLREKLHRMATDGYDELVRAKHLSVLAIAEEFFQLDIPFSTFLTLLPPMRVRQYSISSSPLTNPSTASLTYAVLVEPALSGNGRHIGVASSYLASLAAGDKIQASVRPGTAVFRLPDDHSVPLICVAAGTGIAPFRGFFQERAELLRKDNKLGPAALFFGCRATGEEDLYREELDTWEKQGVVVVYRAYSRQAEGTDGVCKYAQDRVYRERERVMDLWDEGARMYVCGSSRLGEGVKEVMLKMVVERNKEKEKRDMSVEEAEGWFQEMRKNRYAVDVFD